MKKVVLSISLLIVGILIPTNVWADEVEDCPSELEVLEESGELQRYAEDNILYYDGHYESDSRCTIQNGPEPESSDEIIQCEDGITNYAGEQILTEAYMNAIKENYPYYKSSADKYGIPWQAIAAIHYRERRFSRASNPYQITGGGISSDFGELTDEAAQFIKSKGSFGSDDEAKRTFFRYNGTSSAYKQQAIKLGFSAEQAENGEGSPYVMNKYDEKRDPNKNGSNWGQIKRDGGGIEYPANQDFGAFVIYKALSNCKISEGGETPEPGSYAEAINQKALEFAWPDRSHAINDPKPVYYAAIQDLGFTSSKDENVKRGSSCDVFVTAVLNKSGADPNITRLGAANQRTYLESSSRWVEVPLSEAAPGDIRTIHYNGKEEHGNHIEIVVSVNGSLKVASASYGDRTAAVGNYYSPKSGVTIKVFRRVDG